MYTHTHMYTHMYTHTHTNRGLHMQIQCLHAQEKDKHPQTKIHTDTQIKTHTHTHTSVCRERTSSAEASFLSSAPWVLLALSVPEGRCPVNPEEGHPSGLTGGYITNSSGAKRQCVPPHLEISPPVTPPQQRSLCFMC